MSRAELSEYLGVGLYTVPQAAKLAHVPASAISRWIFGYSYQYGDERVRQPAVVRSELSGAESVRVLTFRDLIEVQFVHAFRKMGVSWKVIRLAAEKAKNIIDTDHPFSSQKFLSDGRSIFADLATEKRRHRALVNLANDQLLFRSVMLPALRAGLEFEGPAVVRWWPLGKRRPVVVDPDRQFGQPISQEGVPTSVLAGAFESMGSMDRVARWYDVSKKSVKASIEFERKAA
jgi:uncharacterized protein (DUF433 family)